MITLNGMTLRNLEEQVQFLTEQINALKQIALSGVTIKAIYQSIEELPDPYDGDIGDCVLVKNDPDDLYIYSKENDVPGWHYLSQFPMPGPRGFNGNQGPKGDPGASSKWFTGIEFPSGAKDGDMFLQTSTYDVYRYTVISSGSGSTGSFVRQCNIKGIPGLDGENGNSISSITSSHSDIQRQTTIRIVTTKGGTITFNIPDGEPGVGFRVAHVWPEDDEDIPTTLPADIVDQIEELWPAEEALTADAVLVKTSEEGDFIFVILTTDGVQTWDEAGQIQSVQGPAGQDGTVIQDSEQIEVESVGENVNELSIKALPYLTTAPNSAYTPIGNCLKLVVLNAEPDTYYSGYYYIITEA